MKEFAKMFFSLNTISRMSFFGGRKVSDQDTFFIDRNLSSIRLYLPPFSVKHNSLKASRRGGFAISSILSICGCAKIFYAVVGFVSIYMINNGREIIAPYINPYQLVKPVSASTDFSFKMPLMVKVSNAITNTNFWSRHCPCQDAGIRIITNYFSKFCLGDSHRGNLSLFVQEVNP